jgi:ornithine--oxo-acid transaminase
MEVTFSLAVAITADGFEGRKMTENAAVMGEYFRNGLESFHSPFIETIRKGFVECHCNTPDPSGCMGFVHGIERNGLLAKPTHGNKIRFAPLYLSPRLRWTNV